MAHEPLIVDGNRVVAVGRKPERRREGEGCAMSNVAHYDLEARVKERIDGMTRDEAIKLLRRLVDDGSVNTVREIAAALRVK